MPNSVELDHVEMRFGATSAVRDLSLAIRDGEFFSILGPSGCGKTTVLRLVAGFMAPTKGVVRVAGLDVVSTKAEQRRTAMIFQSLALFPLMPVWENIAFGLEARGVGRAERRRKADALLDLIALPGFGDRKISELSGGQKQRVAIARALAVEPRVLLLDEPLSALDLKLRQHMRAELRAIQKRTGVTFLYITHDQGEALAMSDRVGVMNAGVMHQVDTPEAIYNAPRTAFVASFVGESSQMKGQVTQLSRGEAVIETALGRLVARADDGVRAGEAGILFVRPNRVTLSETAPAGENSIPVQVVRREFEGAFVSTIAAGSDGSELVSYAQDAGRLAPGSRAHASFRSDDAIILRADDLG
jgi:spermidine/putrescine transport system ATP-binding protein